MMKKALFLSVIALNIAPVMAEQINGVAVCAARCNTESLEISGHNEASVGKVYYAEATSDNLSNTLYCLSNAKEVDVISNRLSDDSLIACSEAMLGKFYGKKVDIDTQAQNFSIKLSK
jgi:hypothetical protein